MKIASPKLAPAPKTAERPQLSTTKSGNTGIVPPTQTKPADSFQSAKPTGTGSTSGTTGITPPKTQSISTYALPPHLEAHRATFDKYGEHIAKLPSQVQPKAIDNATDKLFKDLGDIATWDEIKKGLTESVAFHSRGTTTEEPQYYALAADATLGLPSEPGSSKGLGADVGVSIQDPTSPRRRHF